MGYERSDLVDGKGQFSIRGGILDIGTSKTQGYRIEFWGDEVDSVRSFSIVSQRSNKMLEKAVVYPSHELVLCKSKDKICKQIENITNLTQEKQKNINEDIEQIKNGSYISKIDKYFNFFYEKNATLLNYINDNYLIFVDDIEKIEM